MSSKKLVIGIAAGVAALAIVGLIVAKKKSKKDKFSEKAREARDNFKSKLNDLQRKAKKRIQ
ncbi:hypothetical protein H9W95_17040 [Flavobacterium lindanitolerans]|nr:hypothetical protein [Flavobacterium lindanitolerans]